MVLSLAGALGTETVVDLLNDVGDVADGFFAQMFQGVTTRSTGIDLVYLVVDKVPLVYSIVSGASNGARDSKGDSDSGELDFSDHSEFERCKGGKLK